MRGSDAKHVTSGTEGRNVAPWSKRGATEPGLGLLGRPGRWSDGKLGIAFDGNGTGELIVCATIPTDGDGMPDPPAVVRSPAITAQVARSPTRVTSPEAPGTTAQLPARRSGG
jgi:hypothetical protein